MNLIWIWPEDNYGRAENVVAIQIEVADDLLPDNLEMVESKGVTNGAIGRS